jgi:hypothetical protein
LGPRGLTLTSIALPLGRTANAIAGDEGFGSAKASTEVGGIAMDRWANSLAPTFPPNPSFAENPASWRMIRILSLRCAIMRPPPG